MVFCSLKNKIKEFTVIFAFAGILTLTGCTNPLFNIGAPKAYEPKYPAGTVSTDPVQGSADITSTPIPADSGAKAQKDPISAVPEYIISELNQKTEDYYRNNIAGAWGRIDQLNNIVFLGNVYMAEPENNTSLVPFKNCLYSVYKVDIARTGRVPFSYYFYCRYENIEIKKDGSYSYFLSVPTYELSKVWGNSGEYVIASDDPSDVYAGDASIEDFYNYNVTPYLSKFNVSDKLDITVCSMDTFRDWFIDANAIDSGLTADMFAYRYYDGYYLCTGFTPEGFNKLMSFGEDKYVKIVFPDQDPQGKKVEGFVSSRDIAYQGFYYDLNAVLCSLEEWPSVSSPLEDELYSINKAEAPFLSLVFPKEYTEYYGFYEYDLNDQTLSSNLYKIKNVTLGSGTKRIHERAFLNCGGLESIELPASLTEVRDYAFYGCTDITEIEIPKNVMRVGDSAFNRYDPAYESYLLHPLTVKSLSVSGRTFGTAAFAGVFVEELVVDGECKNVVPTDRISAANANCFADDVGFPFYLASFGKVSFSTGLEKVSAGLFAFSLIRKAQIPKTVRDIEDYAFYNCYLLSSIDLPDGIMRYGADSFTACPFTLAKLKLGGKSFGAGAFRGVHISDLVIDGLITFSSTVNVEPVFEDAVIDHVSFGQNALSIPAYLFCNAYIRNVEIPTTVREIGDGAFYGCANLETIFIPDSVTVMGENVFTGCRMLLVKTPFWSVARAYALAADLDIKVQRDTGKEQASIKELKPVKVDLEACDFSYAYYDGYFVCTGFSQTGYNKIVKYTYNDYIEITLPSKSVEGKRVEGFVSHPDTLYDDTAFDLNFILTETSPLISIVCPDSYTDYFGFSEYGKQYAQTGDLRLSKYIYKLKNVTLGSGMKRIRPYAFYACEGLCDIKLPEGLTSIMGYSFAYCTGISDIEIPGSVNTFGKFPFLGDELVIQSIYTGGLRASDGALSNIHVSRLYISGEVSYFNEDMPAAEYSFAEMTCPIFGGTTFDEVNITNDTTKITEGLLACSMITEIAFPDRVRTIEDSAFFNCPMLKKVTLNDNIREFGSYAFGDCSFVLETFDPSRKTFGTHAFSGVEILDMNVSDFIYYADLTSAPFAKCIIDNVTIKAYLTERMFEDSYVKNVVLYQGVRSIGENTFLNCDKLETVTCPSSVTHIDDNAFRGCPFVTIISVDCEAAYKFGQKIGIPVKIK